jgi:hypothetical protein
MRTKKSNSFNKSFKKGLQSKNPPFWNKTEYINISGLAFLDALSIVGFS